MRLSFFVGAIGWFVLVSASALAADYSQIGRTVNKEPAYQSKAPQYALLVFGRDAGIRVWVVVDGETVYLDRNGDGDLTRENERFANIADCKGVEIAVAGGTTRYVLARMRMYTSEKPVGTSLMADVEIKGRLEYEQYCDLATADSPLKASIAHFDGPLTMGSLTISWAVPTNLALVAGEHPTDLQANLATLSAKDGCWVVVRSHDGESSAFPKGVHPVADIEFPPKKPGDPTVKRRYSLDQFC